MLLYMLQCECFLRLGMLEAERRFLRGPGIGVDVDTYSRAMILSYGEAFLASRLASNSSVVPGTP